MLDKIVEELRCIHADGTEWFIGFLINGKWVVRKFNPLIRGQKSLKKALVKIESQLKIHIKDIEAIHLSARQLKPILLHNQT